MGNKIYTRIFCNEAFTFQYSYFSLSYIILYLSLTYTAKLHKCYVFCNHDTNVTLKNAGYFSVGIRFALNSICCFAISAQMNDFQMSVCVFWCVGKFLDVNLHHSSTDTFPLSTDTPRVQGYTGFWRWNHC